MFTFSSVVTDWRLHGQSENTDMSRGTGRQFDKTLRDIHNRAVVDETQCVGLFLYIYNLI